MAIYIRDKQGDLTALNIPAINGKSAYEVALSNGFEGTEQEWLKSLKGENGSEEVYIGTAEGAPPTASMVIDPEEDNEYDGFFTDSKYDYLGKEHSTLKAVNDSNIEHVLRRVSTQKYEGSAITANNTYMKQVSNVILKGVTQFKDVETGDFIESFEEGKNLELAGSKGKKIQILSTLNLFCIEEVLDGIIMVQQFRCKSSKFITVIPEESIWFDNNGWTGYTWARFYTDDEKQVSEVLVGGWSVTMGSFDKSSHKVPKNATLMKIIVREGKESHMMCNRGTDYLPYSKGNPYKSSELSLSLKNPLYSIGDVYDYIDLKTGLYVKNIGIRRYQYGDESNSEVITDKKNTIYKLEQPVISKIDLQGKIYSYDGVTHYTCQSELGYPSPILSMEVPTDLASLVQEERAINKKLYNDQNTIIDSQLSLYESMSNILLKDNNEVVPEYIQDLYELAYERGIRIRKQEVDINENTR